MKRFLTYLMIAILAATPGIFMRLHGTGGVCQTKCTGR